VVEQSGSPPRAIRLSAGADAYVLEVATVGRLVQEGRRCHALMGWEESLVNMRPLDQWRDTAGLRHNGEDRESLAAELPAAHAILGSARGE
jgi:hypothetical protein